MKKRYGMFVALIFMCSFSFVSAQTLEQYKNPIVTPPTMQQLVGSSDFRAKISLDDLKLVYMYCSTQLKNAQNQFNYYSNQPDSTDGIKDSNLRVSKFNIDYFSQNCPIIQSEINSRPIIAPISVQVQLPQKKITSTATPEEVRNTMVQNTEKIQTDTVQFPTNELTDLQNKINFLTRIVAWMIGAFFTGFVIILWKIIKK